MVISGSVNNYYVNSYFLCYFYRSDEKARPRVQKKQKDSSYLNTFSNKIKQNIDKYRTELTGEENEHGNEDNPAASTVRNLTFVYYDVKNITSSWWCNKCDVVVMWSFQCLNLNTNLPTREESGDGEEEILVFSLPPVAWGPRPGSFLASHEESSVFFTFSIF